MGDRDDRDRSRDRSRRDRMNRSDNIRDRSNDRGGREPRSMKSSNNRVYVSNIPYEYRWQDIKDLFREQVGNVEFVELFVDDNDKPKGCGIVEFTDSSSVNKCLELMQRYEVKGRKLVVKDDSGTTRDKHGAIMRRGGGGGGNSGRGGGGDSDRFRHRDSVGVGGSSLSLRQDENKWGNTYGLSVNFLESLNIEPPLVNRVFVANLPYDVQKKKLKEVFRLAGQVLAIELPLDKEGRSRGFAVVEYSHPVEAVQAISLFHNQVYMERTMAVRMDRVNEPVKLPEGLKSIGMGLGPNGDPLKNVALNLPSLVGNNANSAQNSILGSVQSNPMQLASALSGLGNVSSLAPLQQAAANLLGNGLGGTDLSSLVQYPLASQNNATQAPLNTFSQQSNTEMNFRSQQPYSESRFSQNFDRNQSSYSIGSASSNSLLRSNSSDRKRFSSKVLVSNLPQSVSFKLLQDKFNEFGDVVGIEEKNADTLLITYGTDWQAERAIKNLDKARIDGIMIDARLYF